MTAVLAPPVRIDMEDAVAFSWARVPKKYRRLMLEYGLQHTNNANLASKARTATDRELTQWCQVFGSPPSLEWFAKHRLWWVFRSEWLPNAPDKKVEALYVAVANHRGDSTKLRVRHTQVKYLQGLNDAAYLRKEVRKAFVSCYQEPTKAKTPKTRTKRSTRHFKRELEGMGKIARPGWPHQTEAWDALDRCSIDAAETTSGLVVFPTGAGKTFTATKWLTSRVLRPYDDTRVLWLAHREELLWQAYVAFANSVAEESTDFQIRASLVCSGGDHYKRLGDSSIRLAIVSVPGLGRSFAADKKNVMRAFTSQPTVVVVDEAHHAGAASYQALLKYALDKGDIRVLLGLTATPKPTGRESRKRFFEIFPKDPIAEAEIDVLTDQGILARPEIHVFDTLESITLAEDEIDKTDRLRELAEPVLSRLITDHRDRITVDAYRGSKGTFGKTLVFAINRLHADRLGERFAEVAPTRVLHGASDENRSEALTWFEQGEGPKVLVNVEMLTEGVDLPSAQTVVLARPTASYILLRQMIGRALRGVPAGGASVAHIVYMLDHWTNFSDVLDPVEVIDKPGKISRVGRGKRLPEIRDVSTGDLLPPAVILAAERIYQNLESQMHVDRNGLAGYYVLDERRIPVFAHQTQAFEDLIAGAAKNLHRRPLLSFFNDTPEPAPSALSLKLLDDFVQEDGVPEFVPFRDNTNPLAVAQALLNAQHTERSRKAFIRSQWEAGSSILVYPDLGQFEEAVQQEVDRMIPAEGEHRGLRHDVPLYDSDEQKKLLPRVPRDTLPSLQADVGDWIRDNLPHLASRLDPIPPIRWTDHVVPGWFAQWTLQRSGKNKGETRLSVNSMLSTEHAVVSDEMLRYLIYHEMLHHLLPLHGHDRLFCQLEARWPGAVELDARFEALQDEWELHSAPYRRQAIR